MQIFHTTLELRQFLATQSSVGFVPTMGNLHAGHLQLVSLAKQHVSCVVVSIFVNPLQFGPSEDFSNYPRTLEADCEKLKYVGADVVFAPTVNEMYPDFDGADLHQTMTIQTPAIANTLCGASRPGHFVGVATVVMKLFNLVQPQLAVFGKKDYQQWFILREMVKQFNLPIEMMAGETKRESTGLAMSSRNGYLTEAEKHKAIELSQALHQVALNGLVAQSDWTAIEQSAQQALTQKGWDVDYIAVRSSLTLLAPQSHETELLVLGAAKLGKTRLIDNIEFCAKPLN